MSKTPKDKDQEKGDAVLRRLLKTPPDHKTGKGDKKPPLQKRDHRQSTNAKQDASANRQENEDGQV